MKSSLICEICGGGPYKNKDSLRRHKQKSHPGGAAESVATPEPRKSQPVGKQIPTEKKSGLSVGKPLTLKKSGDRRDRIRQSNGKKPPVQEPLPGVEATRYYCVDCGATVEKHQWQCSKCHRRLNWAAIGVESE
jgi:hypothetical protein